MNQELACHLANYPLAELGDSYAEKRGRQSEVARALRIPESDRLRDICLLRNIFGITGSAYDAYWFAAARQSLAQ
jgi:hypothetical protein